jgi:Protein of unknown function (DUF3489)
MFVKLTDTELVMMSAAARRDDRDLEPPKSMKASTAAKVAAKLIASGLVREIKAKKRAAAWRRDEKTGQAYSLKLTAAGLKAIVVDVEDPRPTAVGDASTVADNVPANTTNAADAPNEAIGKIAVGAAIATTPEIAATKPATGKPREGTKIARVIELLRRDQGAALDELIAATGWLPHTARAALTGLRHRGYEVRLERGDKDRASVYRVVSFEAMAS